MNLPEEVAPQIDQQLKATVDEFFARVESEGSAKAQVKRRQYQVDKEK
jgi:regulator of protease activity HflC (stomatin/prohibitin superfamily)